MKLNRLIIATASVLIAAISFADNHNNSAFVDPNGGMCGAYNDQHKFEKSSDTRIVMTNNPDTGEIHLKCRFSTTPTLSGNSWVDEHFSCGLYREDLGVLLTTETHIRQTPKGDLMLQCHFTS